MNSNSDYSVSKLRKMPEYLKSRIYGQDQVIDNVVDLITINLAGLGDKNKPIASFLFTGPTGVGKTELAKEIAKYLDMHFERFDMSEYADEYSARNLTGGQKGLVGYDDGGLLTNAIKNNPNCVLLLDEIEKAHKAVYNSFLQVLDYGTLTDTQGNKTDFRNIIIIMTSNLGANEQKSIGFGEKENSCTEYAVAEFLTPEFRNRLDMMLEFNKLGKDITIKVIGKYLDDFSNILKDRNIVLEVSQQAKMTLNVIGFNPAMGARSVQRAINNEFKKNISKEILFGELRNGGNVNIGIENKSFIYSYKPKPNNEQTNMASSDKIVEYDFETAEEALSYAKNNVGTRITRARSGYGYNIVKNKIDIN